jgi:ATP-dependent exoDNAse (exonuclease V) beta subunit
VQNFVVYKSSAGSGKTFTLVKEYLRLALYDEKKLSYNYKRILAVTFTNKAAAEMKNRVIGALDQIANHDDLPFIGSLLCDELNISDKELKQRAKTVLIHILHHYSDFAIGTIDSFTHKLVKTFAHDLKLPVNFNIELDTQVFYDKVISELFSRIGEDEYVSKLLKEFALTKAEDNAGWDPERQIREFSKLLLKEDSGSYITKLNAFNAEELEQFRKQFIDFTHYYKHTLKTEATKALNLIGNAGLSDDDFLFKKAGPQNFFRKCTAGAATPADADGKRLQDAIEKNKWSGNASATSQAAIESMSAQLNALAVTLTGFIRDNYSYYALCELLGKQMYPLMLLKKIEEISLEKKQDEKLVFISEFNQKIFEIINNEPTPFIYERLGERYRHYLLDEFQDTSSLQWQNILPLLDNSLAGGWFNLIVGDGKQSIYRWRNANVQQFASLPAISNPQNNDAIEERAQSLHRNFSEKFLDTNYRSVKTIVEFNNALFEFLKGKLLTGSYEAIYHKQAQQVKNENDGYITIHTGSVEKDELDAYTCNIIKQQVESAIQSGFAYKDICVLARRNYHGNVIANYLVAQKIPVVSSDSLLLKHNFEINAVISYLKYMVNPDDVISAAAIVNYLFQSGRIHEADRHSYFSDLSKKVPLGVILKSCHIHLDTEALSLNNLLDNCITIINALQLNKQGYQYIRFFLDEVNEFLVSKNSNISSFFDWWEIRSGRASMIIPDTTDAVKIMTIHASKGLEFPVVIIPYCNWSLYQANDSWVNVSHERVELPATVVSLSQRAADSGFEKEFEAEQQEQLLDNLNLLYVAFTRAVERLHVISTSAASNKLKLVNDWIKEFMQGNYSSASEDMYEIGAPSQKQSKHSAHVIPHFNLLPLAFDTPKDVIRIKAAYLNNTQEAEHAKQQGILVHWLLSKIGTEEDVAAALQSGATEGLLREEELPALKEKLTALIRHPKLVDYFKPGTSCKLEAELITDTGELLRPDRVVFTETDTVLIDYKTGKENNNKYLKQMLGYETALIKMGYVRIKKLLVYIDELAIVDVK